MKFLNKSFALIMTYSKKQLHKNYLFVYQFLFTTPFIFVKQWPIYHTTNFGKVNLMVWFPREINYKI